MRAARFLAIVLYVGYLVNAGLLFILLPWSRAWGLLLTAFPPEFAIHLDQPWFRGVLSAFGVLHLLLVVRELFDPTLLTSDPVPSMDSQDTSQS